MADRSFNKAGRSSSKHNDKDKTLDGERRDRVDDQRSKSKGGDSRPKDSHKRKGDGPSTIRHDSPDLNAGGKSVAQGHSAVQPAWHQDKMAEGARFRRRLSTRAEITALRDTAKPFR